MREVRPTMARKKGEILTEEKLVSLAKTVGFVSVGYIVSRILDFDRLVFDIDLIKDDVPTVEYTSTTVPSTYYKLSQLASDVDSFNEQHKDRYRITAAHIKVTAGYSVKASLTVVVEKVVNTEVRLTVINV
jgi:hypothetical protein